MPAKKGPRQRGRVDKMPDKYKAALDVFAARTGWIQVVPPPLLPRKRELSVDGRERFRPRTRRTNPQDQSPFISKLPTEVRLQIYRLVLGGRLIHIDAPDPFHRQATRQNRPGVPRPRERPTYPKHRHMRHYHCSADDGLDTWYHWCWFPPDSNRDKDPEKKLLALLLTCRVVYSEAISFLYSSNNFDIGSIECLEQMPMCILPQRLQMIRSLKMYVEMAFLVELDDMSEAYLKDWNAIWRQIFKLSGLKEVRFLLWCLMRSAKSDVEERVLDPIVEQGGGREKSFDVFDLYLFMTPEELRQTIDQKKYGFRILHFDHIKFEGERLIREPSGWMA